LLCPLCVCAPPERHPVIRDGREGQKQTRWSRGQLLSAVCVVCCACDVFCTLPSPTCLAQTPPACLAGSASAGVFVPCLFVMPGCDISLLDRITRSFRSSHRPCSLYMRGVGQYASISLSRPAIACVFGMPCAKKLSLVLFPHSIELIKITSFQTRPSAGAFLFFSIVNFLAYLESVTPALPLLSRFSRVRHANSRGDRQ